MNWKDRLDKLLSREFLVPLAVAIVFVVAFFVKDVPFEDFAFWLTIVAGIPAGALTLQKLGKTFSSRK